jgi:hypothetical protein
MPTCGWNISSEREAGARGAGAAAATGSVQGLFQESVIFKVKLAIFDFRRGFGGGMSAGFAMTDRTAKAGLFVGLPEMSLITLPAIARASTGTDRIGSVLSGWSTTVLAGDLLERGVCDFPGPFKALALTVAGRDEQQAGQRSSEQKAGRFGGLVRHENVPREFLKQLYQPA